MKRIFLFLADSRVLYQSMLQGNGQRIFNHLLAVFYNSSQTNSEKLLLWQNWIWFHKFSINTMNEKFCVLNNILNSKIIKEEI